MINSYEVREFNNLIEALLVVKDQFKDHIAFIWDHKKIKYFEFYQDVMRIKKHINGGNVVINVKDLYLFAICFFACQFSKALPFVMNEIHDFANYELIITDNLVLSWLDEPITEYEDNVVIEENDPAVTLFSSGTTSLPKLVVLSHKNLCSNVASGSRYYGYFEKWTCVNIIPFTHSFGLTCDVLGVLFSGGTIVTSKSIIDFFNNLRLYNPDFLNLPPSIVNVLLDMIKKNGSNVIGTNLKKILVGGAKCNLELIDTFKQYGVDIYGCYGLTECSPCVSVNSELESIVGSEGRILDCNSVKISSNGEIIVKGKNVMLNYYEEYIKGIIIDEFHTKDIGYIKDGYLYVDGRLDNLIVFENGFKIQPEVIEDKLKENSFITDVVIALNNCKELNVYIVGQESYEDTIRLMLTNYFKNCPFNLKFIDQIIKNKNGKIDRKYYKSI